MYLKASFFTLFNVLFFIINCNCNKNDGKLVNEFVVQIPGGYSEAKSVAQQMGFILDHKMIGFDDLFIFKHKSKGNDVHKFYQHRIKRSNKVNFMEQQIAKTRVKRAYLPAPESLLFNDLLYRDQWYLRRSRDQPSQVDMNVIEAWQLGYTGRGVVVSILDDGIDYRHPDLRDNYDQKASYDINGGDNDPLPNLRIMDNRHGTRCAGEVAAKANNSKCGVGIAFNARIGAVRMLDGEVTDRVEAEALSLNQQYIDIYSGSWGPDDNGQKVEGPAQFAKAAFEKGAKYGRRGLGNIYVWASGNGGSKGDSCACDGYAGSIYTLSVSSVSENNQKPWYLESCASTLISTYSSGGINEKKIISTDLNGNCALDHTGTSASAPLAAGIIALLLEANRNLTWRDVQYITVLTANTKPFLDESFIVNGANRRVSNLYGFGLMDSGKMVRLGRVWQTLPTQHVCISGPIVVNRRLTGEFVERLYFQSEGCSGSNSVNYIEHVVLYLSIDYQRRGDLQIFLISPAGTRSEILPYRQSDSHSGNTTFDKWPLMSVQFWGELSSGKWTLELRNKKPRHSTLKNKIISFSVEMYGTEKLPIHLRPPPSEEKDSWFQQFERYVVTDGDTDTQVLNTYPRDVANTSSSEQEIIKCHHQCHGNKCNGWGPQHCLSCNKYITYYGTCVDRCPSGTYLNGTSLTCQSCHFSCDECIGDGKSNCSRCHIGDSFSKPGQECSMSSNGCQKGFFKVDKACTTCGHNCSICTSQSQCSQCNDGFVLTLNSQCRLACDLGSIADYRGRCHACHKDCLQCVNGNSFECTNCDHRSFMLPIYDYHRYGKCLAQCQPSYFTNSTTRTCYRCNQDCKTCTGPSRSACTDCILPMIMSPTSHLCIDPISINCKPDEYLSASSGSCVRCSEKCQTCTDSRCTSCPRATRYFYNDTCAEKCPDEHFSLAKDNVCLSCKRFCDPCRRNETFLECSQCYQANLSCTNHCKKGEYWNHDRTSCQKCHSSCLSCNGDSSKNCIQCINSQYSLSSGECNIKCSVAQYPVLRDNHQMCLPCHSSCKDSLCHPENGKCINCPKGHKLSPDGRCERIITCPMTLYWKVNESLCTSCNKSCRSCSSDGPCDSCPRDHCLHPSHSTCHQCCSPFQTDRNCFKCIAGREFCSLNQKWPPTTSPLRYYIITVCCVLLSVTILFVLITLLLLHKGDMIAVVLGRWTCWGQSYWQYTMLNDHNYDDAGHSGEHMSDYDSVIFERPKTRPYILLPTISPHYPITTTTNDNLNSTVVDEL